MQPQRRSLRAIADLARAGVGRHGSTQTMVQFRVHHVLDRPGWYRSVLEEEQGHQYIETLTSAAHGVALIIETYDKRDAIDIHPGIDGNPRAEVVRNDPTSRLFGGVAQPNPSFLFEGTTVLEGLVSVDPTVRSGDLRRHNGAAVYRLLRNIADLAADQAKAPILSLQAPALVPPTGRDGKPVHQDKAWPDSSSLAVRFAIAIGDASAEQRVSYVRSLTSYCQDNGLGLWVTDLRPNHRAGNWFEILGHKPNRAARRSRRHQRFSGVDDQLSRVLPVTLVGPARVGSTQAMLKAFTGRMPAILASSITALDDLAFIHFQFGLTEQEHAAAVALGAEEAPPVATLEDVEAQLQRYGIEISSEALTQEANGLAGFLPLIGPAMEIDRNPPRCRPVWLQWEVDSSVGGLREMILGLSHAMDELVEPVVGHTETLVRPDKAHYPNIEYLISRDLGVGSVRAKGKLQVPDTLLQRLLPLVNGNGTANGDGVSAWQVELGRAVAKTLEETWLMDLRRKGVNPRELRVAWREWWLGR